MFLEARPCSLPLHKDIGCLVLYVGCWVLYVGVLSAAYRVLSAAFGVLSAIHGVLGATHRVLSTQDLSSIPPRDSQPLQDTHHPPAALPFFPHSFRPWWVMSTPSTLGCQGYATAPQPDSLSSHPSPAAQNPLWGHRSA